MTTVAPSADALCTVDALRANLARATSTDPLETDRLQDMINSYSRYIRGYTGRQFLPVETGVAKRFRYEGSGYLSLRPYDLKTVTSVTLYTDMPQAGWVVLANQTVTTESQYRLEPRNGTLDGTYTWLSLPELGMYSPLVPEPLITRRARGHEVTVLGDWGIGYVPSDVARACIIACVNEYRNPAGFQFAATEGVSFGEVQESGFSSGWALPRRSRALLSDYRKEAMVG